MFEQLSAVFPGIGIDVVKELRNCLASSATVAQNTATLYGSSVFLNAHQAENNTFGKLFADVLGRRRNFEDAFRRSKQEKWTNMF